MDSHGPSSLRIGDGGWCAYFDPDLPGPVYVRFAVEDDGRLSVAEFFLPSAWQPITATALRLVPFSVIEATANAGARASIVGRMGTAWVDVEAQLRTLGPGQRGPGAKRYRIAAGPPGRGERLQLGVPDSRPYPDAFYARVTDAYRYLVDNRQAPAPALAEANNVPVTTVHRWVREARKRGIMNAASHGKVGG